MFMFKKILLVLAVLIVVFVVVVLTRPDNFKVERSATIPAPPAAVFAQVNDLHKWKEWSPWAKLDPNAKETFSGPEAGKGASFAWSGNSEVGEGSMTITDSRPNELVAFNLVFVKPFAGTSTAEFTFKPEGDQTNVTWAMSGRNNFIAKAIGLFMDCDKMVGGQFEQGFTNLKAAVAKTEKAQASSPLPGT
jgi:uncharacterized protein YndB with AHSA1/START domain